MNNQSGSVTGPQQEKNELPIIEMESEPSMTPVEYPSNEMAMPAAGQQLNVQALMSQAAKTGNVEMAERLLDLYERLEKKWAKQQFDKAMAKFQHECPVIKKTKVVYEKDKRTERYRFAALDSIVEQSGPHIANNGLSYTIKTRHDDKMMTITVTVKHIAGHSEDSEFSIPIGSEEYMSVPQKYGARCTFAKRYAFCNAFGILTGDGDNDAQEDKQPAKQDQVRPADPAPQKAPNLIKTPFLNQVKIKLKKLGASDEGEALQLLQEMTGIKWFSMKASEKQAEFALKTFQRREEKKKDMEFRKEPKEGDFCTVDGKVGTLMKVDGKLICLIENATEDSFLGEESKKEEAVAAKANESNPPENPKNNFPISKGKVNVIKGMLLSKRGYKTEYQMVQYINQTSSLGSPDFPRRKINNIEDLNMDEADKIIKVLMMIQSEKTES